MGDEVLHLSTFLMVPLTVKKQLFGAIVVAGNDEATSFSRDDELIVSELSRKMTLTLENTILYHTLYMHVINTLQALVASVEAKDRYTERHSQRVTYMAKKVAQFIGCSPSEVDSIEFAGLLHDIGKIGVRDTVLGKEGPLTEDEWAEIRRHPEIGESIVKPLKLFTLEASIIRHHHEQWDGKGYPDGLKGTDIPLLSRIISVADSFDAMVSSRPYRPGKPIHLALQELQRCKNTQFDPEIVVAFVHWFSEKNGTASESLTYEENGSTGMDHEQQGTLGLAPASITGAGHSAYP
jgi:HD-GYP domain-containing protein (c-di-GMP phosphodiesterase class II)